MRANLGGVEIYYLTYGLPKGRGIPIVVLHGGPGLDHTYFRPWCDVLGDAASIVYMDLRGNGRSGGLEDLRTITLDGWAADAKALMAHLGLEKPVVMGHGYGGFVAQHYARAFPDDIRGLILCDTAPALDYPQVIIANAQAQATPAQLGPLVAMLTRPIPDDATLKAHWKAILPLYFHRYDPKVGNGLADAITWRAEAYNRGLFGLADELNSLEWLPSLRVPALILAGRYDWLMPPTEGAERLAKLIPNHELAIFEESGHFPFIEEPVAFCKVVRTWLRTLK